MAFLSSEQTSAYWRQGFVAPVPVFTPAEVDSLLALFSRVFGLLAPDESPYAVDSWEKYNRGIYDLVMDARILDIVESLIGPDFYQWSSQVLCKQPFERIYIPWHQDLGDWPLSPGDRVLTAWLALDNTDLENGCLQYVAGSHRSGILHHELSRPPPRKDGVSLVPFQLVGFDTSAAVPIPLRAGEMTFHHPALVHGSDGNNSPRRRFGFQIAYAATDVRCDTSVRNENGVWEGFDYLMARGVDRNRHHILLEPPHEFGRGPRKEYRILSSEKAH